MNQLNIERSKRKQLLVVFYLLAITSLVSLFGYFFINYNQSANAISTTGFDAGNIMSDAIMANKNSLTQPQIQSFLNSKNTCKTNPKNPSVLTTVNKTKTEGTYKYTDSNGKKWTYKYYLNNGKFICLADQKFGGETAAQIIYKAAQDYSINPQVLIVLLQKENSLITDNWPNYNYQYATATGYACPDSGPNNSANCDKNYFGFKNQVRNAASMFRTLLNGKGINNYPIGTNYIQYNPASSCGGSDVNVKNRATGALYTYTPYQPNAATLKSGWPSGEVSCGAYGNLNFYMQFKQWFGSTQSFETKGAIGTKYSELGSSASFLGIPTSNEVKLADGGRYQSFKNGRIYWSSATGAWSTRGGIQSKYIAINATKSSLNYPVSDELKATGGAYQKFENGQIYWSSATDAQAIEEKITSKYLSLGSTSSYLGYPVSDTVNKASGSYQKFQNGYIFWNSKAGTWNTRGGIQSKYLQLGGINSFLGYPTSTETKTNGGVYQNFQKGRIYWSSKSGASATSSLMLDYIPKYGNTVGDLASSSTYITQKFQDGSAIYINKSTNKAVRILGGIKTHYDKLGGSKSFLGYPTSSEVKVSGGVYQNFQKGRIYWSSKSGAWSTHGAIQTKYLELGADKSFLGYPTSSEVKVSGGVYQNFQKGRIYWSSKSGAWSTHGAIQTKYIKNGAQSSKLGYPKSSELPDSINGGVYQKFIGGTIHWRSDGWSPIYYY